MYYEVLLVTPSEHSGYLFEMILMVLNSPNLKISISACEFFIQMRQSLVDSIRESVGWDESADSNQVGQTLAHIDSQVQLCQRYLEACQILIK